jgi:hypothetical protein
MKRLSEKLTSLLLFISIPLAAADDALDKRPMPISPKPLRQEKWGGQTNGVVGGLIVTANSGQQRSPTIAVLLREAAGLADRRVLYFGGEDIPKLTGTNAVLASPRYYMATNLFCGPMELRDSADQPVALRVSSIASPEAYPMCYSLRAAEDALMRRYSVYSGPPLPTPLMGYVAQLSMFHLEDYFALKQSGKYQLTVWPKVYKWLSATNDLCYRIDVPPVSVTVKWP